jgi:hypothetical protein
MMKQNKFFKSENALGVLATVMFLAGCGGGEDLSQKSVSSIGSASGSSDWNFESPSDGSSTGSSSVSKGSKRLVSGLNNNCMVEGEQIFCWGRNDLNSSSNLFGFNTDISYLARSVGLFEAELLAKTTLGGNHQCSLADGAVLCSGNNSFGQLGRRPNQLSKSAVAVEIPGLSSGIIDLGSGENFSCALDFDYGVYCWGSNSQSQLGKTGGSYQYEPRSIPGLESVDVEELFVGVRHSCAIDLGGSLYCWGNNEYSQLGRGVTGGDDVGAAKVKFPSKSDFDSAFVEKVALGQRHSCALADEQVYCWGHNFDGQVAGEFERHTSKPVHVRGLPERVQDIVAGESHSCALAQGRVFCWGKNIRGQVGDGSTTAKIYAPIRVRGLPESAISLSAGQDHTCALLADESVYCWGDNRSGQLGVGGEISLSTTPVKVKKMAFALTDVYAPLYTSY